MTWCVVGVTLFPQLSPRVGCGLGRGVNLISAVAVVLAAGPGRLTVDTHLHVTMDRAAAPVFRGEPGSGVLTASTRAQLTNQIDADQLISAGGQLAIASLWPPFRARPGRAALDEALHQLSELKAFCQEQPQFVVVGTAAEAREQIAHGRIALIPGIEGGEGIESVEDVDRLYAAGARSVTLVHFADSQLGGAAKGQFAYNLFGRLGAGENPHGLTGLGRDVVRRMLQLGMLVDLAHASDALSRAVLDLAEAHGAPVINTHGGSRALLPMERNISDELAARIARGGGMVGLTASRDQVARVPDSEHWEGYLPGTCDDLIAHWKHLATVVPPAQLNLGSDFNGMIRRASPGGSCPDGLRNTGDLPALYDALVRRGVPAGAIDGMGWRFLQTWEAVEERSDPEQREKALEANPDAASTFDIAL